MVYYSSKTLDYTTIKNQHIIKKLASVSLLSKSRRSKTANIKIQRTEASDMRHPVIFRKDMSDRKLKFPTFKNPR